MKECKNCLLYDKCAEHCSHEDAMPVAKLPDTSFCWKCKGQLVSNEVEIYNMFQEIGGFCNNEKCERYLLLVV